MGVMQRVLGLIPKKSSREERQFLTELVKAVDSIKTSTVTTEDISNQVVTTLQDLGATVNVDTSLTVQFPETPTGFVANGLFTNVLLEWNAPTYQGHAYAEIYRADVDDLDTALENGLLLRSYPNVISDEVQGGTTHYYWVRFVNLIGQKGAFHSPNGYEATTSLPVSDIIAEIEANIVSDNFAELLAEPVAKIDDIALLLEPYDIDQEKLLADSLIGNALQISAEAEERRGSNATIVRNDEVRASEDEALASTIELLQTNFDDTTASIFNEQTALSNALGSETTQRELAVSSLETQINGVNTSILAAIDSESTTRAEADLAETAARNLAVSQLETADSNLQSSIQSEASTRADSISAETSAREAAISQLQTEDSNLQAAILTEQNTRVTQDNALSTRIDTLQSVVDDNSATIQTESTARATADSALSSQITTVQASLGDDIASVQQFADATASSVDGLLVKYGVKLDVNGYVTGFGQNNDGTTGSFFIRADRFAIIDPASNTSAGSLTAGQIEDSTPFVVENGNTYIKNAYITKLTSDNILADSILAESLKVDKLSAVSANMGDITAGSINIGNGKLTIDINGNLFSKGGVIQSSNFVAGLRGFRLNSAASGTSVSPNIEGAYIKGGTLEGAEVLFSTQSGNLAPYFYSKSVFNDKVIPEGQSPVEYYTPSVRIFSENYLSGLYSNRAKSDSTTFNITTNGAVSGLVWVIQHEIQISRDGGSWQKLDELTTYWGVNKVFSGTITGYSNYFDLRVKALYQGSPKFDVATGITMSLFMDNTV